MDAYHLLLGRPWHLIKDLSMITSTPLKLGYILVPLSPSEVQPNIKTDGVGNTSVKTLFLGETQVKEFINKGKTIYPLFVLEK